jgi:hypothetical protein
LFKNFKPPVFEPNKYQNFMSSQNQKSNTKDTSLSAPYDLSEMLGCYKVSYCVNGTAAMHYGAQLESTAILFSYLSRNNNVPNSIPKASQRKN